MQQRFSSSLVFSILLHVLVLVALVFSFDRVGKNFVLENSNTKIINAVMMSAPAAPVTRIMPPAPMVAPAPPAPAIKQPPRIIPAEKPRVIEPPKEKAIALEEKKPKPKPKTFQPDQIQKELLAEIKQHDSKQKRQKQLAIEKEFAKELKSLSAQSLQRQLLAEQKRVSGEREQKASGVVDKYKALIQQVISQHWVFPTNIDKNLSAQLLISLAPGGTVMDVQIAKTSGNPALDSSARAAVFKSSPLPVPAESSEFEPFRRFVLVVRPELFENGQLGA